MATKASALLCPLHHAVGAVHLPFAAALTGDPESLRTRLKLYAPTLACAAFSSCLCCLPGVRSFLVCWSPLAFFPPRPRVAWSCLPASLSVSWLVFLSPPSWFWFGLLRACFCLLGLSGFLCVDGFGLFSLFRLSRLLARPTSVWTGTFVYFALTCTTKVFIDHSTCVSVRRLDGFTCTVEFHRSTTSYFN